MSNIALFPAVALFLFLLGCATPQHAVDEKYYLISANTTVPYWQEARAGMNRAAELLHVKAEMAGPETYDPKAERDEFLATLKKKPTGILISASDANLLKSEIDAAIGQGIPVITIDSDVADSKRLMYIGTDNYKAGTMGAKVVVDKLQGKGNVVVFTMPGQANLKDRLRGYTDTFADHPQIKIIEIVDIELSEAERAVYDYVLTRAKRTFNANVEAGTVMKAYTSIFAQILRLRQTCCHPTLVRKQEIVADEEEAAAAADAASGLADDMDLQSLVERFTASTDDAADSNAFGAHVLTQIRDEAANECPICAEEPMVEQTVTGCWHSACKKCLLDYIKHQTDRHEVPRCFQCRETINSRDLFEVVRHDDDPDDARLGQGPRIRLQRLGVNNSSAKIVSLLKHLRELRRENPTIKSVVFSQFTSFLSLIEPHLSRANMHFVRLDGTLSQKMRAAVLNEFRESKKFTVLLISLKAGGVGLNLISATRVFMLDPWWSWSIESQAIDRVHRMGQEAEVKVYRFIVKDSVEERMLKIQLRKQFM